MTLKTNHLMHRENKQKLTVSERRQGLRQASSTPTPAWGLPWGCPEGVPTEERRQVKPRELKSQDLKHTVIKASPSEKRSEPLSCTRERQLLFSSTQVNCERTENTNSLWSNTTQPRDHTAWKSKYPRHNPKLLDLGRVRKMWPNLKPNHTMWPNDGTKMPILFWKDFGVADYNYTK